MVEQRNRAREAVQWAVENVCLHPNSLRVNALRPLLDRGARGPFSKGISNEVSKAEAELPAVLGGRQPGRCGCCLMETTWKEPTVWRWPRKAIHPKGLGFGGLLDGYLMGT